MRRSIVIALLTVLWSGVLYMEVVIWTDYCVNYRGMLRLSTAVTFSVAQVMFGLLGTLSTVPFWMSHLERRPNAAGAK